MSTDIADDRSVAPSQVPAALRELFGDRARFVDLYGDPRGAALYDDIGFSNTAEIYEILSALRKRPGPVLELAAGSGRITIPLLRAHHTVTAVDLAADMLAILADRIAALGSSAGSCDIRCADMVDIDCAPGTFDSVVIATTSASLLTPEQRAEMFTGIARALTDDGILLISTVDSADGHGEGDDLDISTVTGSSGTTYRMHELWPAHADARHLAVVEIDPTTGEPRDDTEVHLSRVGVVPVATLTDELRSSGFEVRRERAIRDTAGTRHRYVLLEAALR